MMLLTFGTTFYKYLYIQVYTWPPNITSGESQFVSEEFQQFTKLNGIIHIKSAPYHPATNGLAERFVQTFKQSMRVMKGESSDLHKKLANFLLVCRNTPHSITNETPLSHSYGLSFLKLSHIFFA
jgi:transposase InsO family protein